MTERARQVADRHEEADVAEQMRLQLSAHKKPKRKVALKASFKTRLGL